MVGSVELALGVRKRGFDDILFVVGAFRRPCLEGASEAVRRYIVPHLLKRSQHDLFVPGEDDIRALAQRLHLIEHGKRSVGRAARGVRSRSSSSESSTGADQDRRETTSFRAYSPVRTPQRIVNSSARAPTPLSLRSCAMKAGNST